MFTSKLAVLKKAHVVKSIIKRRMTGTCGDSYCDWATPEQVPMTVAIIGGHTGEGILTALLLKQSQLVDEIRLYSSLISPCGDAYDISHIDTNCQIKAYTGQKFLKDVVTGAQVVLVCGGHAKKPCTTQEELFRTNADYVRNIALYMSEFNQHGILCISTPPISSLVPMVAEELKKENTYDPRKVIGIMTLGVIKATSIVAKYTNNDPCDVIVPVIGGLCRNTIVPIFSQIRPHITIDKPLLKILQEKIACAEDEVLELKYIEDTGSCYVSNAFSTARFVSSVIKGLKGESDVIDYGFVRQLGHVQSFLPYMGTIIKLGRDGVDSCYMPRINDDECEQLQKAYLYLKKYIALGESYVCGEKRHCRIHPRMSGYCQLVTKKPMMVGDIKLNLDDFDPDKKDRCIEIIT